MAKFVHLVDHSSSNIEDILRTKYKSTKWELVIITIVLRKD